MIPFGAIAKGVKGLFDVQKMDENVTAIEQQVASLPPVGTGLLDGLPPRQRAEAALKLLMIEADWRRRMGEVITEYEERIGKLVTQVRELQLKETPATKWDIEVMNQAVAQLAEDFRKEVAAIEQRAQDQARRVTNLADQLSKESAKTSQLAGRLDKQHGSLKATVATRTTSFIVITLITFAMSAAGLALVMLRGH